MTRFDVVDLSQKKAELKEVLTQLREKLSVCASDINNRYKQKDMEEISQILKQSPKSQNKTGKLSKDKIVEIRSLNEQADSLYEVLHERQKRGLEGYSLSFKDEWDCDSYYGLISNSLFHLSKQPDKILSLK